MFNATGTRRIVAGLFISLDGVVEAPETWHFPYVNDEMGAVVGGIMAGAETPLLGRTTYEAFAATWPHQTGDMADALNAMPDCSRPTPCPAPGRLGHLQSGVVHLHYQPA